ncbi:MAG: hypothetical protein WC700_18585 [Gemmatimonadaceae bacterium]
MIRTVAALYVLERGPYSDLEGVDLWPESRDARLYAGPHPVVAHPPCARWGAFADGSPRYPGRFVVGDDGGCFAAALASVRQWGGVLEHPARSKAWKRFGLSRPPCAGGWVPADTLGGWTCHVEQGAYGHAARKATWLYAVVPPERLPALAWGPAPGEFALWAMADEVRSNRPPGPRVTHQQRAETPPAFRDLLLQIARSAT